jgi:hypothetical protein
MPPIAVPERMIDTATIPMQSGAGREKEDEAGKALALAKTFDSFDATLRLAAMTDQVDDFRDYITATQKMRAYRGKIESTSPLAASAAAEARKRSIPRPLPPPPVPSADGATASTQTSNFIAIIAIIILSLAAVGLTIALLVK